MQSQPRRRTCGICSTPPTPQLSIRSSAKPNCYACSAKSIAPCRMHSLKKNAEIFCDGELRGATRGTPRIPTSLLLYRYRSLRKINCTFANCSRRKIRYKNCVVGCEVRSGVLHASNSECSLRSPTPLRFRSSAKSVAPSQNALVEKVAWWVARC